VLADVRHQIHDTQALRVDTVIVLLLLLLGCVSVLQGVGTSRALQHQQLLQATDVQVTTRHPQECRISERQLSTPVSICAT
jgi:hypothetical protein